MSKFYLTTAIPYVNGKPHIGHALEYFQADTIRRYHDLLGEDTLLLSGADENALKNVQAAETEGQATQLFLDRNSAVFREAFDKLGVRLDVFQRGSDQDKHWPGVQKLWQLCLDNGDIYKKAYSGLYCVGCEAFKDPSELVDGKCPDHLKEPDQVTEENYFFKLSKYQNQLVELIENNEFKITPDNKRAEALSFIKQGLEDFSVSRAKERARGVGVPVPHDPDQVIYVWFDALNIYMTGLGFGTDEDNWKKWWPADLHLIGKDISRFHTVYWPTMLLSAKIALPKEILIHSFINAPGGQKMSKTLGNVIDPFAVSEIVGLEGLRYFLLSQIPIEADGEASVLRIKEVYNSDLANGLGNLISRVAKLAETNNIEVSAFTSEFDPQMLIFLNQHQFNLSLDHIWRKIRAADQLINLKKPWELSGEEAKTVLTDLVKQILHIGFNLQPFLPNTARKILDQFSGKISSREALFPRI